MHYNVHKSLDFLMNIVELEKKKNISLDLKKIKIHMGIWNNKEEDNLTKKDIEMG